MAVRIQESTPATTRQRFLDAEQPTLLRTLRRCSLSSDYTRWEALRADLNGMGYRVVVVKGVEHLRPIGG
jgi:hypothetical protein